jgi:hypothetical protein
VMIFLMILPNLNTGSNIDLSPHPDPDLLAK